MAEAETDFTEGRAYAAPRPRQALEVSLDGYAGPLDVLLALARTQKLDLAQISILQLVEQYLVFIRDAENLEIELAADYLVMAAWLTYLKSRLLLPDAEDEADADGADMSAQLIFRLQRLEAMREAAAKLMARDLLGRNVFAHGMAEGLHITRQSKYRTALYELLAAYATQRVRNQYSEWSPPNLNLMSVERARKQLERVLDQLDDWQRFDSLLMRRRRKSERRSVLASSLSAALEFARDGRVELQQAQAFAPLHIRRTPPKLTEKQGQ